MKALNGGGRHSPEHYECGCRSIVVLRGHRVRWHEAVRNGGR